jgi:hypothetical protein
LVRKRLATIHIRMAFVLDALFVDGGLSYSLVIYNRQ